MSRRPPQIASPPHGTIPRNATADLLHAMALLDAGALLVPLVGAMTRIELARERYSIVLPAGLVEEAIHEHQARSPLGEGGSIET